MANSRRKSAWKNGLPKPPYFIVDLLARQIRHVEADMPAKTVDPPITGPANANS